MEPGIQEQLINDLLVESFEGLDRYDQELLALEAGSGGPDTLNVVFRVIHTVKGTAGCLGFSRIEKVAHVGENLLDQLRSGRRRADAAILGALLGLSDALRALLRNLEAQGAEGDADHSELVARLERLASDEPVRVAAPEPTTTPAPAAPTVPAAFGFFDDEQQQVPPPGPCQAPEPGSSAAAKPDEKAASRAPEAQVAVRATAEDGAIRVDVAQLDRLMNLVGELVLARNQILQKTSATFDPVLVNAAQRLNAITSELQEGVMKTRMQPIGNVWAKFPRIVRDVAHDLGKKVRLVLEGKETELDRTIIEAIKDPLIHIVRNSVDHGIEAPGARAAAGKHEEGLLTLRAFHEGGQVIIEVVDDGAGIKADRVKAKAVKDGRITPDQAARMTEREACGLIFLPGLSTADKVTNVSGRGVGMDVVKTNIERIGGSIDLRSETGLGTTLRIKIPLTLAIIPALVVKAGGERFAIPQVALVELVRIDAESGRAVESLYGAPVYRLRDRLLPLAMLDRELGLVPTDSPLATGGNLVVLQAEGRQFGLVVDEILDTQEIVVKPLSKLIGGLAIYAGATIMGDGHVALILDVIGLAQNSRILSGDLHAPGAAAAVAASTGDLVHRRRLLIVDAGAQSRLAIPLDHVNRLEEFDRSRIERSAGEPVVQYRDRLLPLVPLSRLAPSLSDVADAGGPIHVVVHSAGGRSVGLVVGRVSDIVEERVLSDGGRESAVVQGRVVDVLDLGPLLS